MNRFPNPYAPQTLMGTALQNIAGAIMARQSPRDIAEREALAQSRRAQTVAYEAAARESNADAGKRTAEADAVRRGSDARFNFFGNAATNLMPDNAGNLQNFIRGTPSLAYEGGVQPRPSGLTAGDEQYMRTAMRAAPFIAAGGGEAHELAQAFGLVQDAGFKDQVAAGSMPGSRFLVTQGKTPYAVQDHTLVNLADGILGPTTEHGRSEIGLNNAKVGTERAHAGYYGASSQAQSALAGKYNAEASNERAGLPGRGAGRGGSTKMQWVIDENGQTVLMDQSDIQGNPGRYTPTNAGIENPRAGKVDKNAGAAITAALPGALAATMGNEDGANVPSAVQLQIKALAEGYYTDPNSPAFQSPVAAARMAAEAAEPSLVYTAPTWRTAGDIRLRPGGSIPAPARATQPAARSPARPPVPPEALDYYRQHRSTPGLRQQFIQKYGFDPDSGA